jgi:adenosylmethionine-8-amino-7-oxononanoate aminotransferase
MHAWQQDDIRGPDLQMVGKSLGGGFIPISGVLVHQRVFETIATPAGALAGGHTFQVCGIAIRIVKLIADTMDSRHTLSLVQQHLQSSASSVARTCLRTFA